MTRREEVPTVFSDNVDANIITTNVFNVTNVFINVFNTSINSTVSHGFGPARHRACAVVLLALLLSGCGGRGSMVGTWDKVQSPPCADLYPERLILLDDGTYVGGLLLWNGGKYDLVDDKRIKLETRTGPGLYEFELSGSRLTFKTDWGCSVKYAKRG
jgi:hypothetical protein